MSSSEFHGQRRICCTAAQVRLSTVPFQLKHCLKPYREIYLKSDIFGGRPKFDSFPFEDKDDLADNQRSTSSGPLMFMMKALLIVALMILIMSTMIIILMAFKIGR